jgi:hypothetical protein
MVRTIMAKFKINYVTGRTDETGEVEIEAINSNQAMRNALDNLKAQGHENPKITGWKRKREQ